MARGRAAEGVGLMERVDGYQRTAAALKELPPQERDWFLQQLAEQDRARVAALLQDAPAPAAPAAKAQAAQTPSAAATIAAASFDTLQSVLGGQPDWVIALVLIECGAAPRVNECVDQFLPPRGDRVRQLAARLRDSVKPAVSSSVVASVAGRIKRHEPSQPQQDDFR